MSSKKAIAAAIILAQAGVDYSPKTGATCPCCRAEKLRVETSKPWDGTMKVRFHVCTNKGCLICKLGQRVKSIEVDATQQPAAPERAQSARV